MTPLGKRRKRVNTRCCSLNCAHRAGRWALCTLRTINRLQWPPCCSWAVRRESRSDRQVFQPRQTKYRTFARRVPPVRSCWTRLVRFVKPRRRSTIGTRSTNGTIACHTTVMPQHIGIVACSAEGAALCYRTICAEGAAAARPARASGGLAAHAFAGRLHGAASTAATGRAWAS